MTTQPSTLPRPCPSCERVLSRGRFRKEDKGICLRCAGRIPKRKARKGTHELSQHDEASKRAVCGVCGPVDLYQIRPKGRQPYWVCGERARLQSRKQLLKKYGLSLEDYDAMLRAQGGTCKICGGTNAGGHSLAVDHDHTSGKVRDLLCNPCNVVVGHSRDSPEILTRMIQYLESHT